MEPTETDETLTHVEPTYLNRLGEKVTVTITHHARMRFQQRWKRIFPKRPLTEPIDTFIATYFNQAERLDPKSYLNRRYKIYLKRYGRDVLYFKTYCLVFIVRNSVMITVFLGTKRTRHLNQHQARPTEKEKPLPPDHSLENVLARNTTDTDIMMELYLEHNTPIQPDTDTRIALAKNKHLPPDLLKKLVHDTEPCVRKAIAHHKKLPLEFFEVLANDSSDPVRAELAQNPKIPSEVLDGLAQNSHFSVLKAVMDNKKATKQTLATVEKTLRALLTGEDVRLRDRVQQSLNDLYWRHGYQQTTGEENHEK